MDDNPSTREQIEALTGESDVVDEQEVYDPPVIRASATDRGVTVYHESGLVDAPDSRQHANSVPEVLREMARWVETSIDARPPGNRTDWLAHTPTAYGYGTTKDQALATMAAHLSGIDGPTEVSLVEHVGPAQTGAMGWKVDYAVQGEVIEIPEDEMQRLADAAVETTVARDGATEAAEHVRDIEIE